MHQGQSLVPAGDQLSHGEFRCRAALAGGVKDAAVNGPAGVVHQDLVAQCGGSVLASGLEHGILESRGKGDDLGVSGDFRIFECRHDFRRGNDGREAE